MTTAKGHTRRCSIGTRAGVLPGIVLAVAALAIAASSEPSAAEPDARLFAAHALALRAAGVAGDESAQEFLAGLPGAGALVEEALSVLWQPFFENAIVKLGRLRSPAPVALYYNPLLDIALLTLWERHEASYRVVVARALPGERQGNPDADVSLQPQWMAAEDGPIEALARITAARLGAFRRAHPAQQREGGKDPVTFATAAADLRAAAPRLAWNLVRRVQLAADAEPWLQPALTEIEEALAVRDAAVLTAAAPDTDAETAAAIAALPAEFIERLTLDMALDAGGEGRLLIGSLPDDGAVYVFVLCRLEGDACALGRFVLASVLE